MCCKVRSDTPGSVLSAIESVWYEHASQATVGPGEHLPLHVIDVSLGLGEPKPSTKYHSC
jgi:hypothetical protein